MHTAILHIGSNLGHREKYLSACRHLIEDVIGKIVKTSKIYETKAWGLQDQPDFLNQAFIVETILTVVQLLRRCQKIERILERTHDVRWGPRTMDVDIIFFENMIVDLDGLSIPHPRMHERNFVLEPLAEIAPDYIHPKLGKTVLQLKELCNDDSHVSI